MHAPQISRPIVAMKSAASLLLLALVVTQAHATLFHWDNEYQRINRRQHHEWMTNEQLAEIEPVASDEEIEELREIERSGDKHRLVSKIESYKMRLPRDIQEQDGYWNRCYRLLGAVPRRRRDLDKNFDDFTGWMTDEQKKTVSDMKDSGKSYDELRQKTIEFFEALPAERQKTLKEEFKGKCKAFFKKIATEEEMQKMKALHESGSTDEVRTIVKEVIGRQTGDDKVLAVKMEAVS
ncbi:hypothetical protein COOONC_18199 [Cooperia oncophora]